MKKIIALFLVLSVWPSFAQDSIEVLDEVMLSDFRLYENSDGFKVKSLNDSVISKNQQSLTSLLRFNSNIYFKENGHAMVASPSFRGTSAAQTAVIWNGININSQLNGQTDFNTIYTNNYNNISVRSGGGSVLYGSGAIGGSVHLNNKLQFLDHFNNELRLSYGSFETKNLHYNSSFGNENLSISAGVDYAVSDNNYRYLGTNRYNENAHYENLNLNLNSGIFLNQKNVIKFFHNTFLGDKNFSGGLYLTAQDRYKDENSRSLVEWQYSTMKIRSKLRFAQIYEHYKYFGSQISNDFSFGKTNKVLTQYDFKYNFSNQINLNAVVEYSSTKISGSDVSKARRNVFAGAILFNHQLNEKFGYGLQLRKEIANDYESPVLFAADAVYQFSEVYALKLNISKNFRMPTFNDLYWQPGGNIELTPEKTWQAEIGQELDYKDFAFSLNAYYIQSEDLIKWIPQGIIQEPRNIAEAFSYGLEAGADFQKKIENSEISFSSNYAYTISKNAETGKQLMYVPFHKATVSAAFSHKKLSAFYQFLWNGNVFTTSDESLELEGYNISNIGISYTVFSKKTFDAELFLKLNNIYNTNYQITSGRPMPPRNFQIQLTLNI